MSIAFSPDGHTIASSAEGVTSIFLWDVITGNQRTELRHESSVKAFEFSRDGKTLISADGVGDVRGWDLASLKEAGRPMGAGGSVAEMALSPDGATLVTSHHFGIILLRDLRGRGEPVKLDTMGSYNPSSISFSPDGKVLAYSAGEAGLNIVLWNVASARPRAVMQGFATTNSMVFTPNGKRLITGHSNGAIALWDIDTESWPKHACEIANRNFTRDEWKAYVSEDLPYSAMCPKLQVPKD